MNVRQIVWHGALWGAVMTFAVHEAQAGCSAVGCGRIDWTEVIETDAGAAVDVHGAFVFAAPALGWAAWRTSGHFVAECGSSVEPVCHAELLTLRSIAETQTPVVYEFRNEDFDAYEVLPVFLVEEGETPRQHADGIAWLTPDPSTTCRLAFELPSTRPDCAGDCDGNWRVSVAEVISGIRMMVDAVPIGECSRMDSSADGLITVNEVVYALRHSLEGCP
jgi:hypothetical protein